MDNIEIIKKYFKELSAKQIEQFEALMPLYKEWNNKINVISRTDIDNLYTHHILHSLSIAHFINNYYKQNVPQLNIMDLGTGGGFPGVPLAIFFPNINFLLVDSIGKKITVVQNIIDSLQLNNAKAIKGRAEEIDIKEYIPSSKFNWIVSRAVTSLDNFIPWVKGRYSDGILALKGGDVNEELAQAAKKRVVYLENVKVYQIKEWFSEEFFSEKKLLHIRS